jgi:transcriptional regulator with XRE-family HTH domain
VLAAQIGVSESALNMWEAGKHIPNPALLSRWRDLLGV